jgi:hypothetical protein
METALFRNWKTQNAEAKQPVGHRFCDTNAFVILASTFEHLKQSSPAGEQLRNLEKLLFEYSMCVLKKLLNVQSNNLFRNEASNEMAAANQLSAKRERFFDGHL